MDARPITFAGGGGRRRALRLYRRGRFEIALPAKAAVALARALLADPEVKPIASAPAIRCASKPACACTARTSTTRPRRSRPACPGRSRRCARRGGDRAGGFPARAERILAELADGPARLRVGLRPEGRTPVRAGAALYDSADATEPVGRVTSGGFGPSLDRRSPWGCCRARSRCPARRSSPRCAASACPARWCRCRSAPPASSVPEQGGFSC